MCKPSIWTEIEDSDNEEDPAKGVDEETAVEEDKENLKGEIEGVKEKFKINTVLSNKDFKKLELNFVNLFNFIFEV